MGIGVALAGLGAISGLMGSKNPTSSTQSSMPVIMPRAEPFYKQLEADFLPKVYNKPYESPFLMRYNPTNEYEKSPILEMIQRSIDNKQAAAQAEVQAPAPRQPEPQTIQAMIDAALGRQLYQEMSSGGSSPFVTRRGGNSGFTYELSPDSSPDEFAMKYRMWNDPATGVTGQGYGYVDPKAPPLTAGINRENLKGEVARDYYDRIKAATGV